MNQNIKIYTPDENGDKQMVSDLIASMYAGIALMMQAQQKGVSPDVMELAKDLETDHTKLTEELKMYASGKGWLIPAGELDKDRDNRQAMANLDGVAYEKQWLQALRERHATNITKLENAVPSDPKLQSMGEKGLSKLKDLIGDIRDVEEKVAV